MRSPKPGICRCRAAVAVRLERRRAVLTKSTCAAKPPSSSVPKRRITPPSRRLKPMPPPLPPPPPDRPRMSTLSPRSGGTVGSKIDQPSVWQRAQFISNSSWPSLTFARRLCHSSAHATAAWSVVDRRRAPVRYVAARDAPRRARSVERRRRRVDLVRDVVALRRELGVGRASAAFERLLRGLALGRRASWSAASVFFAFASSTAGHVMYSGHVGRRVVGPRRRRAPRSPAAATSPA